MGRPCDKVEIVRLTYGFYVVTAFDLFGRQLAINQSPRLSTETKRREWAIEQARLYAERWGLWVDDITY